MRVKYQKRIVSKTFSTAGGTDEEKTAFIQDIVNALIDMGAPLDADTFTDLGRGSASVSFAGEGTVLPLGAASILFEAYTEGSLDEWFVGILGFGRSIANTVTGNFAYCEDVICGYTDKKEARVCIHAVKSGDSFFFGFIPITGDPYGGCISYALTPMRRLSDPPVSLGYALVEGAIPGGPDMNIGGMFNRTLPFVEGFNYRDGFFNFTTPGYAYAFPETDTGKIPLVPYFAGIEDIYYDKVYVCPMKRGIAEEKAFETDKGTFLIGGIHGVDHTTMGYNNFAFDITEAVNTAQ